jgi:hypothetical protein
MGSIMAPRAHHPGSDRMTPGPAPAMFALALFLAPALALPASAQEPATAAPADTLPAVRAVAPQAEPRPTAPASCPASALAVRGVADEGTSFARILELARSVPPARSRTIIRPSDIRSDPLCGAGGIWQSRLGTVRPDGPGLELLPIAVVGHNNSAYARLQHDGALWTGRGLSSAITAGVQLDWGPLSATLAPMAAHQTNEAFRTRPPTRSGFSEWIYTGHQGQIDWPQRFGVEPFQTLDPGQSQVSLRARGLAIGYGTENVWWGPAQRYPLMMGAGAPGVPSAFLGTHRPVDLRIASVEMELTWGVAEESDYFDFDPDNDRRLLAGLILVVQPHVARGLSLGVSRTYMSTLPPAGLGLGEFLRRPYRQVRENPVGDDPMGDDQMFAIFARWAFPEAGFEAYVEWGREDHWADFGDFMREPDHSRALMAGFQKVFAGDRRWVRIRGEGVVLGGANTFRAARGAQRWYTHSQVIQGHTHRGQLLGSVVGPGADAQFLGADVFHRNGRVGFFLERVRYDDDAYYNQWAPYYGHHGHDIELSWGLSQVHFVGPFDLAWEATISSRNRRHFIGLDGNTWDFPFERNYALRATAMWRPDVRLRLPDPW